MAMGDGPGPDPARDAPPAWPCTLPAFDTGMGVANGSNSDTSGPGRVVGVADVEGVAVGRSLAGGAWGGAAGTTSMRLAGAGVAGSRG